MSVNNVSVYNKRTLFDTYTDSKAGSEVSPPFRLSHTQSADEAHDVRTTILTSFVYIDCKKSSESDHFKTYFFRIKWSVFLSFFQINAVNKCS